MNVHEDEYSYLVSGRVKVGNRWPRRGPASWSRATRHLGGQGSPDMEALAAIRDRYGLDMDMGSIERPMQEHGIEM